MASKDRWRQLGLAVVAGSTLLACRLIAGLEPPSAENPIEAGADVTANADATANATPDAQPPLACDDSKLSRPAEVTGTADDLLPFDLVLGYINSSPTADAGRELCPVGGFDLDNKTTCQGAEAGVRNVSACPPGASCPWSASCTNPSSLVEDTCDYPGGVDNAVGKLLSSQVLGLIKDINLSEVDPNRLLRSGQGNVHIRILGYNGRADDSDVSAVFHGSTGLASTSQPTVDSGSATSPSLERWDGRSLREWYVDPRDTDPKVGGSLIPAARGWVTNHVLVLEAEAMPLPLFLGLRLVLERAKVVGELRQLPNQSWEIVRGRVGGRVLASTLIKTLSSVPYGVDQGTRRVCDDDQFMFALNSQVCRSADLAATASVSVSSDASTLDADAGADVSTLDADADADADAGRVEECKMLSVGAAFVAVPAIQGIAWAPASDASACAPNPLDHCR